MQIRQTAYQIKVPDRIANTAQPPLPMLCHRVLARRPAKITHTALSMSVANMSTTTTPTRKSMPSALTFDRHAKCSVRPRGMADFQCSL